MTEESEEHPSSDEHEVIASEKAAWHHIAMHGSINSKAPRTISATQENWQTSIVFFSFSLLQNECLIQ